MRWFQKMRLHLADLADGVGSVQWHPALPVGKIKKMKTPEGRRPFIVTRVYLEKTRDELRRYYGDLAAEGIEFKRPVLIEHRITEAADELHAVQTSAFNEEGEQVARKVGRRNGDVLDLEIRKFDPKNPDNPDSAAAVEWLFVKIDWRPNSLEALLNRELEDISVNIQPKYTDPETGNTYGPFLLEVSETVNPVIKRIDLTSTMDAKVLQAIGLQLAEDNTTQTEGEKMDPEQFQALLAALEQIGETQKKMLEMLVALEGDGAEAAEDDGVEASDDGDKGSGDDDEPAPPKAPKVEAGDDGKDADPAPESDDQQPAAILSELTNLAENQKALQSQIQKFVRSGALFSDPGDSNPGEPNSPKSKMTEAQAWRQAREEIMADVPQGAKEPLGKISARCAELMGQ